jgi:type III secretion apparatus YscR/HrcR family protein
MNMNPVVLIGTLALGTLLPFLIASGSCFIKFSVVFSLLRNAIGLQQIPSNMTINGIALILSAFVMMPIVNHAQTYYVEHNIHFDDPRSTKEFFDVGLAPYRDYLRRYSDPELVRYFTRLRHAQMRDDESASSLVQTTPSADEADVDVSDASVLTLLPAYALSELKSAFKIGFYIFLPFLVIDMVVSNVLLALGMMMMSPITFALPIKLILFVALDGWEKVVKGLVLQYMNI